MEEKQKASTGESSTSMKMKRDGFNIQFETDLGDMSSIYFIIAVNK
jgi:hypothetical protein